MPSVRLERLSFSFDDAHPLLSDADLHLAEGWTALVGENGAGKTTLLRLLAGELRPTAGRVRLFPAAARVLLCPQRVERLEPPVRVLADDGWAEARRLRGLLGLDPAVLDRWETLSPGERKRWQVGAALRAAPDVLLLDEPTNHLDEEGRRLLLDALRGFRGLGLLVSHDRALLEGLAGSTLRLERAVLRLHAAPYGAARGAWEAERRAAWARRGEAQARARRAAAKVAEARRAAEAATRGRSNRGADRSDHEVRSMGHKNLAAWAEDRRSRDVRRLAGAEERARGEVERLPPVPELGRSVFLAFERAPRQALLSLEEAELRAGGAPLLQQVRVRLRRDDRIWLSGPNGAGKSTLLAALLARSDLPAGRLLHLAQELPEGEGVRLLAEVRALPPEARGRVLSLVAALGSDPGRLLASAAPSPGEARKLSLALGMGRHAWALLLDEPTNHLDLPAVERLEEALAAYPGAILLVTHDARLAARCTSGRWRIAGGRLREG